MSLATILLLITGAVEAVGAIAKARGELSEDDRRRFDESGLPALRDLQKMVGKIERNEPITEADLVAPKSLMELMRAAGSSLPDELDSTPVSRTTAGGDPI